jgi:hypothetical protein
MEVSSQLYSPGKGDWMGRPVRSLSLYRLSYPGCCTATYVRDLTVFMLTEVALRSVNAEVWRQEMSVRRYEMHTLHSRIREVLGSNPDRDTGYPEYRFP